MTGHSRDTPGQTPNATKTAPSLHHSLYQGILRYVTSLRITAVLALICGLTACSGDSSGSPTSSSVASVSTTLPKAPDAPVSLTIELSCLNTQVFVLSADQTLAFGLIAEATGPGVMKFDSSSSNVELMAYRGADVRGGACSGGEESRPTGERLKVTSGSGTLTLDDTAVAGKGDRLTTTELLLSDGTIIAPIDMALSCAGCFPT